MNFDSHVLLLFSVPEGKLVSFPDSFSCAIRRGVSEWAGSIRMGVSEGGGVRRERRRSLVNLAS